MQLLILKTDPFGMIANSLTVQISINVFSHLCINLRVSAILSLWLVIEKCSGVVQWPNHVVMWMWLYGVGEQCGSILYCYILSI